MAVPPKPAREEDPLSEEEAGKAFGRLEHITRGLLRVPKAELDARLEEKRIKSKRRIKEP